MKQKIKQIIYDIRRQPLISGVTFIATAMSVFLLMVVIITQRIKVIPYPPESCREHLLHGRYIHIKSASRGAEGSGHFNFSTARKLYGGLDGIERESYIQNGREKILVSGNTDKSFTVRIRYVDANFFRIFDHSLIDGRYFTDEEANAHMPIAVINESTARKSFGTAKCAGQTILIDHRKFTVAGVVKDHSLLASTAAGDVFAPNNGEEVPINDGFGTMGNFYVALLMKEGADIGSIRDQVKARYAILNSEFDSDWEAVYHEGPYDQETIAFSAVGGTVTPDTAGMNRTRYLLYAILLIVPAINLSSMLHSRMRKRISEIGVRRAYGCTRLRIFCDIVSENFILTLIGGIVGIGLGITFAMTYSGLYESMGTYGSGLTPAIRSVINWGTILIALGICFILNLISASLPAWQASRLNPVEAINAK